ncbi:hypothetical protein [Kitasatospora sp. NPDC088346]|uniref:hypothetical protein n=1 Tax=Kitasatospora sp. NPDC088346 TaxID=3364073 RepID=UPI00381D7FDA
MADRVMMPSTTPAEQLTPQVQYEGRVLSLVVRDLAAVEPKAGESVVMTLVAKVWELAERHASYTSTRWEHLSWFAHHVVASRAAQQMTGCRR